MRDEKYTPEVGSWLKGREVAPRDSEETARRVATRLPHVRQRSRWWPFPVIHRRSATSSTSNALDQQPSPIPASNGHIPTVIGRTQSMFSPVKAITAGAIVFALGGAFLIAQPFGQQASLPGAVGDVAPQPPVEFSGTWCIGPAVSPDRAGTEMSLEIGDEGASLIRYRGGAWRNTVEASDPRFQGDAYQTYESDTYTSGSSVRASTLSIVNENGAWVDAGYGVTFPDGTDRVSGPAVFVGQDAYEGLVAFVDGISGPAQCSDIQGVIFDQPPVPVPYLPE